MPVIGNACRILSNQVNFVERGPVNTKISHRAQISQYGIYSVLSMARITSHDDHMKEEILKLIDKLATI